MFIKKLGKSKSLETQRCDNSRQNLENRKDNVCNISSHKLIYCKDEKSDHKVGIYCNLIGPLDQYQELHFVQRSSKICW